MSSTRLFPAGEAVLYENKWFFAPPRLREELLIAFGNKEAEYTKYRLPGVVQVVDPVSLVYPEHEPADWLVEWPNLAKFHAINAATGILRQEGINNIYIRVRLLAEGYYHLFGLDYDTEEATKGRMLLNWHLLQPDMPFLVENTTAKEVAMSFKRYRKFSRVPWKIKVFTIGQNVKVLRVGRDGT